MLDLTVAIRTYNRASHLSKLLERLSNQVQAEDIAWEVIVVDNNSSDNTAEVVEKQQLSWPFKQPLRYHFEPLQGAAIARRRAFQEANGRWVGFLDDDNIPAQDWIYQAYLFNLSHPDVGAYGGKIQVNSEEKLPKNFNKIAVYLAIIDRGTLEFCYNRRKKNVLPPGTNIVISKKAWLEAVPQNIQLLGPTGSNLNGKGEDIELLSYLQKADWEIWYAPSLQCFHEIPTWRLERDYLLSLAWGVGLGRHPIRMLRLNQRERLLMPLLYWLNDLRKFAYAGVKNISCFQKDTAAAFEVILLASILMSPIFNACTSLSKKN